MSKGIVDVRDRVRWVSLGNIEEVFELYLIDLRIVVFRYRNWKIRMMKKQKLDEKNVYHSSSRDARVWESIVGESSSFCWTEVERRRDFFVFVELEDNNRSRSERRFSIATKIKRTKRKSIWIWKRKYELASIVGNFSAFSLSNCLISVCFRRFLFKFSSKFYLKTANLQKDSINHSNLSFVRCCLLSIFSFF